VKPEKNTLTKAVGWLDDLGGASGNLPLYYFSADLESSNAAQQRGAAFGFEVHLLFPRDGLPPAGRGLLVALDELLLNAQGRKEYLAGLMEEFLPLPTILLTFDFSLEAPTVVRPGLLLTADLDDAFRAFRDGHVYVPLAELPDEKRKAA